MGNKLVVTEEVKVIIVRQSLASDDFFNIQKKSGAHCSSYIANSRKGAASSYCISV